LLWRAIESVVWPPLCTVSDDKEQSFTWTVGGGLGNNREKSKKPITIRTAITSILMKLPEFEDKLPIFHRFRRAQLTI